MAIHGKNIGINVPMVGEAHPNVITAFQQIIHRLGQLSSPTFSGMTLNGTLEMNDNPITELGYIDFDLVNGISAAEGRMFWNDTDGTLNLGMKGGIVNLQVGQEVILRAKNTSGSTMPNGTVVYISGGTGSQAIISLADPDSITTMGAIGITTEAIANNSFGYVTSYGLVRDVNTTGMSAGTTLWLDDDGGYTTTRPTAPKFNVVVGVVIREHATEGVIFTSIDIVPRLQGLSDVNITSIADGNLMQYVGANSRFENVTPGSLAGSIDHDSLSGFVANEHIDHSAVSVIAGTNLTGGGTIDSDVTVNVDSTKATQWDAAYTHVSSNGTDHGYIDQDLQVSASPAFVGLTVENSADLRYELQLANYACSLFSYRDAVPSGAGGLGFYRANGGSDAAKTAAADGDWAGKFTFSGWNGSAWTQYGGFLYDMYDVSDTEGKFVFYYYSAGAHYIAEFGPEFIRFGDTDGSDYVNISPTTGDITFAGGSGLSFGEIYVNGNATATTISAANTWYQVTVFDTNGQSNNATPDHTNDHITVATGADGKYLVTVSISFTGASSSDVIEFQVYKNNGATGHSNLHCERKISAGGDIGSVGISGIIDLTAADTVELWVQNLTSTGNVTVKDATLSLVGIGG
jgi:hypothetical protein